MAILRTESSLNVAAPPPTPSRMESPSPIPRAGGARSAANGILAEFLEKSLQVPELALPESAEIRRDHHQVAYKISLRSLVSGENDSVDRLLKSTREFGVFRIKCHGISSEELGSLVKEAERVFGILEERDTGYRREIGGRSDNKEEIVWVRSGKERMDRACEYIGAELFRSFSEKVETVASKLDTIAELLGEVLVRYLGKQLGKTQEKQSALSIYKYNHNNIINEQSPSSSKENHENNSCDHILSLHLPTEKCKYWVESGESLFCFNAGPDVIVVTVGKQLEEWSLGEFKCVHGEMIHQPDFHSSFCLELKCSSLNLKQSNTATQKKISIVDQILIGLIIATLYPIFKFLWS